jgi:hypothetical protein
MGFYNLIYRSLFNYYSELFYQSTIYFHLLYMPPPTLSAFLHSVYFLLIHNVPRHIVFIFTALYKVRTRLGINVREINNSKQLVFSRRFG